MLEGGPGGVLCSAGAAGQLVRAGTGGALWASWALPCTGEQQEPLQSVPAGTAGGKATAGGAFMC